jgi:hypothetical protein
MHLGNGAEGDGFAKEAEDVAASRGSQGSVLVVGRVPFPGAEPRTFGDFVEARGDVLVAHCHEVGGDDVVVGGF